MPVIVLLRGINVGGHRRFRPTRLAQELAAFDAVNVGAAGTFVVHRPGSRRRLEDALRSNLPAGTQWVICDGQELLRLATRIASDAPAPSAEIVRFVSFLDTDARRSVALPLTIPTGPEWFVRVTAGTKRLLVGEYRRHMKTIGYLGQLDEVFGTLVTTRGWSTVRAIVKELEAGRGAGQA